MTTRIMRGHVLDRLRDLPDNSVHCVVTSPPYWGLRDYKIPPQVWPDGWAGSLGLEPTPALYIAHLVEIFREVRRVLRRDGSLWLNIGDSYNSGGNGWRPGNPAKNHGNSNRDGVAAPGLKPKDLIGIPWMLAFALRADGWWLRSEITWAKRAPMPESVTDRPTMATEKVFLLTKAARYFYDAEAVAEPTVSLDPDHPSYRPNSVGIAQNGRKEFHAKNETSMRSYSNAGRNMRNWWLLGPSPYPEAHFATFPPEVPRRAILAGTSERGVCAHCGAPWARVVEKTTTFRGGSGRAGRTAAEVTCRCTAAAPIAATVLDPFLGAGTTALVADRIGRDCIGIELSADYAAMAEGRVRGDAPLLAQLAAD
jgi:DNA modification methylase